MSHILGVSFKLSPSSFVFNIKVLYFGDQSGRIFLLKTNAKRVELMAENAKKQSGKTVQTKNEICKK